MRVDIVCSTITVVCVPKENADVKLLGVAFFAEGPSSDKTSRVIALR